MAGRQAGIRGVTWLSIVLFTAFICIVKSYGSIFFWLKTGTSYSLSNRDKLKKKDNTTLTEAGKKDAAALNEGVWAHDITTQNSLD